MFFGVCETPVACTVLECVKLTLRVTVLACVKVLLRVTCNSSGVCESPVACYSFGVCETDVACSVCCGALQALLNLGSSDPSLRSAAYNLLCALTQTFDLKIDGQLLETNGTLATLET